MMQKEEIRKLKVYTINKLRKMEKQLLENNNKNTWLAVKEVEKEFGISRKTIDRMREKGLNVSQPKRNGKILINRTELITFLSQKRC